MKRTTYSGFSVLEVLVSLAILGLLLSVSLVSFASFSRRDAVSASAAAIGQALRDARARTLASVGGSQYGVKVDGDRFTFFQGSTFSSSTPTNNTFMYPSGIRVTSSLSTLVFERVTGNASASGTISVYQSSAENVVKRVRIQTTGLVSIE
jgi:prepilin-type N-terminal cleavage/methylation domain-containing protein